MSTTFKDYIVLEQILELSEESLLGKLLDIVKKKLGPKASQEEIDKEIEKLKKLRKSELEKIAKSKASKEFHDRRAAELKAKQTKGTTPTRSARDGVEDARQRLERTPTSQMRGAQARAVERDWLFGEGVEEVLEAKGEYSTFKSWKAAVKKKHPDAWIEGDADIAQAMVGPKPFKKGETKSVAEWDGAKGELFEAKRTAADVRAEMADLVKKIDKIEGDGGRVPLNDPLIVKLKKLKGELKTLKAKLKESVDEALTEAKREFVVVYQPSAGGKEKRWKTNGRDSNDVRRQFADSHYGMKMISIRPATAKRTKVDAVELDEAAKNPAPKVNPVIQNIIDNLIDDFAEEYPSDSKADKMIMKAIKLAKIPKAEWDDAYDKIVAGIQLY